jgi:hypothetical protein
VPTTPDRSESRSGNMLRLFSIGRSHGEISFMMSRYKGRTSPKAIEQAYPHVVEMIVPPGGFGKQLDTMHEWHRARGIEAMRGRGGVMRMAAITFDGASLIGQQPIFSRKNLPRPRKPRRLRKRKEPQT